MKKIQILVLALLLCCLFFEVDGRGGGGRGGGRGGSRGGSRGSSSSSSGKSWWSWGSGSKSKTKSSGGNYKSSRGGYGSVPQLVQGRTVIGTYKQFGSSDRWRLHGGRSYFYVGYPMYAHHHYHGRGYGRGYDNDDDDDLELMNPWHIMIYILVGINALGCLTWIVVYCHVKK